MEDSQNWGQVLTAVPLAPFLGDKATCLAEHSLRLCSDHSSLVGTQPAPPGASSSYSKLGDSYPYPSTYCVGLFVEHRHKVSVKPEE